MWGEERLKTQQWPLKNSVQVTSATLGRKQHYLRDCALLPVSEEQGQQSLTNVWPHK